MFDLESSITTWRGQMLAAGIKAPFPLKELETHLRDEIECQMLGGLNSENAFAVAVQKIGTAPVLQNEFMKTETIRPRQAWERWLAVGICFGIVIPLGARNLFINDLSLAWRLLGLANLLYFLIAVFGCKYINRLFPFIPDRRTRTLTGLTSALTGIAGLIAFTYFVLPHFTLTIGQLMVVFLWAMTVMITLGAVWVGLEETARRTINAARS